MNCVKKNNIKKGLFTALFLASPLVMAGNDYPASDFQPKVLFQDTEYQHQSSAVSDSSASASFGEKAKADPNYPAATFKPQIVFQDKDYKHRVDVVTSESAPVSNKTVKPRSLAEAQLEVIESVEEESDSANPLFAIIILAIAGFLFMKKGKGEAESSASSSVSRAGEVTGVARYLQNKAPKLSGVAKYLETHQPAPKSGVAKYVAKKVVASKKAAAGKATGVEKYMRKNRG